MSILKRIDPGSAFKVGLLFYALLGLIAGVFCSLIALAGARFAPHAHIPFVGAVGVFAVILCPIVYGIFGGVTTVIGALIYNLAAGWIGGLKVEIT